MSSDGLDVTRSWTPCTNSQTSKYDHFKGLDKKLTSREGVTLRDEVVKVISEGEYQVPTTLDEAVDKWQNYVDDTPTLTFEEQNSGDEVDVSTTHRFQESYLNRQYARLKGLERETKEMWDDRYVYMVTLTASKTPDGEPLPIIDHLDELLNGWEKAYSHMGHVFDCGASERPYLRILEPHDDGYAHIHIAIITPENVPIESFEPLIDSHIKNCEFAGKEAHKLVSESKQEMLKQSNRHENPDLGCVSKTKIRDSLGTGAGSYVGAYIGKELNREGDVLDAEPYLQKFYTAVWASGRRRFQPSQQANKLMDRDLNEEDSENFGEYELKGIRTDDGDVVEVDNSGGGSTKTEVIHPDMEKCWRKFTYRSSHEDWGIIDPPDPPPKNQGSG